MKTEIEISDCCDALVLDNDICSKCEKPCNPIIVKEGYYDEIKSDDERGEIK